MSNRRQEQIVYGVHAALALAERRPDDIIRVFHTEARRLDVGPLLKATAARRRPYREVDEEEIARVAKTQHHEGVVVVARPLPMATMPEVLRIAEAGGTVIALDGVDNPHNIGAILRSAAWFGAKAMIIGGTDRRTLSGAAQRIAQGGAEVVPCAVTDELPRALKALKDRGMRVFGADARSATSVPGASLPASLCLVLGNEGEGISSEVRRLCDQMISIAGSGQVESLNVSVAAGVLLAAAWGAQQPVSSPR